MYLISISHQTINSRCTELDCLFFFSVTYPAPSTCLGHNLNSKGLIMMDYKVDREEDEDMGEL